MTTPQELVERALTFSTGDDCIVIIDEASTADIRWANNTLTTNGVTDERTVTVIAVVGGATGVVSRSGVELGDLEALVRSAEQAAAGAPPADDEAPLVGGTVGRWDDAPETTSGAVFAGVTPAIGSALADARGHQRALFGFAAHQTVTTYAGSTAGLRARHVQPTGHLEINAKSADFERSAWAAVPTVDFADVDVEGMNAGLVTRLGWAARRTQLRPGRYDVLLPPSAVADLMVPVYWSAGARDAFDGRSVFSAAGGGTRVDERLSPVPISLWSDPVAAGIGCAPFVIAHSSASTSSVFDNGLALDRTSWIDRGVLAALLQTRHTAALTGLPVTPPIDNLVVTADGASAALDDMVTGIDRGLLLTCLWYIREVDPRTLLLTGLTRDGVYLVEGGEVVGAVNNFRFNESPVNMLGRLVEVGASVPTVPHEWGDDFTRTRMPPIRVADFNMSSVSEAT